MKRHKSRIAIFVVLAAAFLFYGRGPIPGRILLPADVLCGALPWSNLEECSRMSPANPIVSDEVLQFFPGGPWSNRMGGGQFFGTLTPSPVRHWPATLSPRCSIR